MSLLWLHYQYNCSPDKNICQLIELNQTKTSGTCYVANKVTDLQLIIKYISFHHLEYLIKDKCQTHL